LFDRLRFRASGGFSTHDPARAAVKSDLLGHAFDAAMLAADLGPPRVAPY